MKKCFIYHDEKSNKFWWIDYEGDSLAVNYGKVGSIGKFHTKEFDNEEQCLKEASKLIAAKMKKGYQEDPKFNFMDRYYFDDEEIGLRECSEFCVTVKYYSVITLFSRPSK